VVTVYVDDMYLYPMGRFGRMKMSHMVADTTEELLAMADKIGVARKWIQNPGEGRGNEHFDVAMSARAKAVAAGAKEVTLRELSALRLEWRKEDNAARLGR
jgi:hypothetical protein